MKREDNISQLKSEHDSIEALLPWYVNGTLSPDERKQVEKHRETCQQCRIAISELQNMQHAVLNDTYLQEKIIQEKVLDETVLHNTVPQDAIQREQDTSITQVEQRNLQSVLARIDNAPRIPVARKRRPLADKIAGFWGAFTTLPSAWRFTVVAQFLLLLVVVAGMVLHQPSMEPEFKTLSTPTEHNKHVTLRMRVVFAEDVLFRDIRHLLVDAHARIVDGPTPSGVYTLEAEFAPGEVLQDALDRWRNKALVRFVEPVSNIAARN